jgi:hypothetical protein
MTPILNRFNPCFTATTLLLCAALGLSGCELPEDPKPASPASTTPEPTHVKYPDGNGYVQFVAQDERAYHIRGVFQITVKDAFLHVEDVLGDHYLIPQQRVIYAGIEFK